MEGIVWKPTDSVGRIALTETIAEIIRLRASQFRWIPVSERMPAEADGGKWAQVLFLGDSGIVTAINFEQIKYFQYGHWAPIPPPPEKSQIEKDEDLWKRYSSDQKHTPGDEQWGFLNGLRAAREQK